MKDKLKEKIKRIYEYSKKFNAENVENHFSFETIIETVARTLICLATIFVLGNVLLDAGYTSEMINHSIEWLFYSTFIFYWAIIPLIKTSHFLKDILQGMFVFSVGLSLFKINFLKAEILIGLSICYVIINFYFFIRKHEKKEWCYSECCKKKEVIE